MMNIRNERGVALITALLLTMLTLAIILALLYLVTQGSKVSAANKRYKSALEAAGGGGELLTKELMPKIFSGYSTSRLVGDYSSISLGLGNQACLNQKLTMGLSTAQWTNCTATMTSSDPKTSPDMTFKLKGLPLQPNFMIYTKIVNTIPGNSDASGLDQLDSGSGVAYASSGVSPEHIPAMFTIEVQGERETNPLEKARLSILYSY